MKKEDIKNIMFCYFDNDFVRVFDWIGKVTLMTLLEQNICCEKMLKTSNDIELFIYGLLPVAIEFVQYKCGNYSNDNLANINYLVSEFTERGFKYNFDYLTDEDYIFGGSELLIIDLEKKISYIR